MRLDGATAPVVAFGAGLLAWLGVAWSGVSPNAGPLDSGKWLLGALLAAGFLIGLVQRELAWASLFACYVGQATGLTVQTLFRGEPGGWVGLPVQALFLLSFNGATVVGGLIAVLILMMSAPQPKQQE